MVGGIWQMKRPMMWIPFGSCDQFSTVIVLFPTHSLLYCSQKTVAQSFSEQGIEICILRVYFSVATLHMNLPELSWWLPDLDNTKSSEIALCFCCVFFFLLKNTTLFCPCGFSLLDKIIKMRLSTLMQWNIIQFLHKCPAKFKADD